MLKACNRRDQDENVFAVLVDAVARAPRSDTFALFEVGGQYRRNM